MIKQDRYPEPPCHATIPWHLFRHPQDAYDWAKAHILGFNYNCPVVPSTELFVTPEQTTFGNSFYTDFTDADNHTEVLRLWVKP